MPTKHPETEAQTRTIRELVSNPHYARADVRPLADGSREVWAYSVMDRLIAVHTVFVGGNHSTRPGFREAR